MKIILIATTKLKERATAGPHKRCCRRFAPSDERNTLKRSARKSSKALPELTRKMELSHANNTEGTQSFIVYSGTKCCNLYK